MCNRSSRIAGKEVNTHNPDVLPRRTLTATNHECDGLQIAPDLHKEVLPCLKDSTTRLPMSKSAIRPAERIRAILEAAETRTWQSPSDQ